MASSSGGPPALTSEEERDLYEQELKQLKNAESPEAMAQRIVSFLAQTTDPMSSPHNEWSATSESGCCVVL